VRDSKKIDWEGGKYGKETGKERRGRMKRKDGARDERSYRKEQGFRTKGVKST
jgi:hypothetical protein